MDPLDKIKVQLKKWETSFFQEQQRKPSKADVLDAPEKIKKLYREYKALKESKGHHDHPESVMTCQQENQELVAPEKAPDSGSWGSHLNRGLKVSKPTRQNPEALQASAQHFGMKLKCNLGAKIKESPITLRRSLTPKRKPVQVAQKDGAQIEKVVPFPSPEVPSLKTNPNDLPISNAEELTALLPSSFPDLAGTQLRFPGRKPRLSSSDWFQWQKQTVTKRLSSLDPGWLDRCQGTKWESREEQIKDCSLDPANGAGPCRGLPESISFQTQPPFLQPGKRKREKDCQSPQENCQQGVLERQPVGQSPEDLSTPSTRDNPDSDKERISVAFSATSAEIPATEQMQNLEAVRKDDSRKREEHHLQGASSRLRGASCDGQSGQRPLTKKGKMPSKKRRLDPAADDHVAPGISKRGVCTKRQRTKVEDGSHVKKQHPAVNQQPGKDEYDFDQDMAKGQEEKEEMVPLLSENILGDLVEEKCPKRSGKPSMPRLPPKKCGNFVRLNMKTKSHVKSYALKGKHLRKQVWKQKWQKKGQQFGGGGRLVDRSSDTCFKCGGRGHWASQCKGAARLPATDAQKDKSCAAEEEVPLLTLEEVAEMTNTTYTKISSKGQDLPCSAMPEHLLLESFLDCL
ncbi:PREDICTED: ATP-dependent DNA helicase Q4, partial [Thamnophis sirtalis]|uniref:ATP-dependent DNA helicase Q4 n=1 Tax=Thamnophis sirtalis TaxID=35019 RepID=A0A6I9YPM1_9SAUR